MDCRDELVILKDIAKKHNVKVNVVSLFKEGYDNNEGSGEDDIEVNQKEGLLFALSEIEALAGKNLMQEASDEGLLL